MDTFVSQLSKQKGWVKASRHSEAWDTIIVQMVITAPPWRCQRFCTCLYIQKVTEVGVSRIKKESLRVAMIGRFQPQKRGEGGFRCFLTTWQVHHLKYIDPFSASVLHQKYRCLEVWVWTSLCRSFSFFTQLFLCLFLYTDKSNIINAFSENDHRYPRIQTIISPLCTTASFCYPNWPHNTYELVIFYHNPTRRHNHICT